MTIAALGRTPVSSKAMPNPGLNLICPRCKASVAFANDSVLCANRNCLYADQGFPVIAGQPVLIDFPDSIFKRSNYLDGNGSVIERDHTQTSLKSR